MAKTPKRHKVGKHQFAEKELRSFIRFSKSVQTNIASIFAANLVLTMQDKRAVERLVSQQLDNYRAGSEIWADTTLEKTYRESSAWAGTQLALIAGGSALQTITAADREQMLILREQFLDSIDQGVVFAKKQVSKIITTQVRNVANTLIQQNKPGGGLVGARATTKMLKNEGLKFLVDAGGNTWTLPRYSEMLARTTLQQETVQAQVMRYSQNGWDLVEVSKTAPEDAVCLRYDGNVYSLSGKNKDYPKLDQYPPFHPNCLHNLLPYVDADEDVESVYRALI